MSAVPAEMLRATRFLQPGHLVIADRPMEISTILGSCVAVCLWDAARRVGGMNHFMLPLAAGRSTSPRFGDVAMAGLVDGVRAVGARLPFLQARVFGGACMFTEMQSAAHLGKKNADLALEFLARNGIEIVQVDTGGNRGRKLTYRTDEGTACLKSI
jgi:chemotaxis protein CheD